MSATLKALHATLRQAGITDDGDKRALYERVTGKTSARAMSDDERRAVTAELKRLHPDLKPASKRPNGRAKLTGKYARVLQAYWIDGWNLGVIENRDDAALEKFVKRQTGLDAVRFCHHAEDADKAIEAIKGWLKRETPIVWNEDGKPKGELVATAQWEVLETLTPPAGVLIGFRDFCLDATGKAFLCDIDRQGWITVMNALGERIRAAKAANREVA